MTVKLVTHYGCELASVYDIEILVPNGDKRPKAAGGDFDFGTY